MIHLRYGAVPAPIEPGKVQAVSNYAPRERVSRILSFISIAFSFKTMTIDRDVLLDSQGQLQSDYSERLTICPDDGSYCCGKENIDCCTKHQGLWIRNGEISNVNPSTDSSSTASSTAFSTSTLSLISSPTNPTSGSSTSPAHSGSTSSTSPAQSDSTSSSNNIGAIVGGVVGGIVGITLSAAVAWFISRRRNLSRLQLSTPSLNVFSSTERKSPKPCEISGRERPHEMDGRDLVEIGD